MNKYGTVAVRGPESDAELLAMMVESQADLARSMAELIATVKDLSERVDKLEVSVESGASVVGGGEQACPEAGSEDEASSERNRRDSSRMGSTVVDIGPDPPTRKATDAEFVVDRESDGAPPPGEAPPEARELAELMDILDVKPPPFRIQFLGLASVGGSKVLKEVDLEASNLSAAIFAAANAEWPRQTIGLRVLDREDREVFECHRTEQR